MRISLPGIKLPAPSLVQKRIVALDIGGSSVRVLVAKGGKAIDWREAPLEPGLVREGVVADAEGVAAAIKPLLPKRSHLGDRLMVSVTGVRAIPRVLELPRMKEQMLDAAVSREAKREMPVPMEEIYLAWQVLEPTNGNQRVFALGVPRDILDPLLRALEGAAARPYAVDIKPLALARAADRREVVIADLEPDAIDIILVCSRMPAIMRTVTMQADGTDDDSRVERLYAELARTIKFYNDTHRQEPLSPDTPIVLTGSLAKKAAAVPLPEELVQYETRQLLPPLECPPELPLESYAVAVGLALKEAA